MPKATTLDGPRGRGYGLISARHHDLTLISTTPRIIGNIVAIWAFFYFKADEIRATKVYYLVRTNNMGNRGLLHQMHIYTDGTGQEKRIFQGDE